MLITNGAITRSIAAGRLPEYQAKGYTEVKAVKTKKPAPKKADEKAAD